MPSGKRTIGKTGNTLIVFFKCPEEGRAKTRLSREIGAREALNASRALIRYTFSIVEGLKDIEIVLLYDPGKIGGPPKGSVPKEWRRLRQGKGDMGQRFMAAFRTLFRKKAKKIVVIGADCIGLTSKILSDAFDGLDTSDVVIGPAEDGGYYLLGLKDPALAKALLTGITWGSDRVLEETLGKATGLKVHRLPRLFDVDMARDWERALREEPRIKAILNAMEKDGGWP